jgi:uncharacterized protein (TIGR02996 family)
MHHPPELLALLREARERPEDDVPYSVLADWLADHDQGQVAELIRVHRALERLDEDDLARSPLEGRHRELLPGPLGWVEPFPPGVTDWWFEKGLLHLAMGNDAFTELCVAQGEPPDAWGWIGGVKVSGPITPKQIARWQRCPFPPGTALDLSETNLALAGGRALATCPALAGLGELNLDHNSIGTKGVTALASSPHLAGIRRLGLARNRCGREGALALAASPYLSDLTHLNLEDGSGGWAGLVALMTSPYLSRRMSLVFIPHEEPVNVSNVPQANACRHIEAGDNNKEGEHPRVRRRTFRYQT